MVGPAEGGKDIKLSHSAVRNELEATSNDDEVCSLIKLGTQ